MPVFPIGAIAAAAAESIRDNEFSGIGSDLYKSTKIYGNLIINKYYKFPEMKYLKPIKTLDSNLDIITVGSELLLFSKEFSIEIDLTKNNTDNEIQEAIKKYSADEYWEQEDQEILEKYLSYVRVQYAIDISADKVKYSTEFHPYKFIQN